MSAGRGIVPTHTHTHTQALAHTCTPTYPGRTSDRVLLLLLPLLPLSADEIRLLLLSFSSTSSPPCLKTPPVAQNVTGGGFGREGGRNGG